MTAKAKLLRETVFPTGLVLFGPLPDTDSMFLMWLGPGVGLGLAIDPHKAGGILTRIDHPTANGVYMTRLEARAAANAFAQAGEE